MTFDDCLARVGDQSSYSSVQGLKGSERCSLRTEHGENGGKAQCDPLDAAVDAVAAGTMRAATLDATLSHAVLMLRNMTPSVGWLNRRGSQPQAMQHAYNILP